MRARARFVTTFVTALAVSGGAAGQTPSDFYKGKTIDLYTWTSVGGAYDTYSRLIAQFLGKHIPGTPTVVARNMEGAGGLRLANYLSNSAPRDGLTIGVVSRGNAFDPLFGNQGAQFDGSSFNWIGSVSNDVSVCVSWRSSGVTKFQDVLTRDLVVGATGPTADTYQYPKLVNAVLGARFKVVTGYPGGNEVDLAMQRGEVQGRCGWSWTSVKGLHQDWIANGDINILFQIGLTRHPDLPTTPLALDFARTPEERAILRLVFSRQVMAWPYLAPPGLPKERVERLRQGFTETLNDPGFRAMAEKAGLDIAPVSGADVQALVNELYAAPSEVREKAATLIK